MFDNRTNSKILEGINGAFARSLYKSMGYTDDELIGKPVIGIANSWNTVVPGHFNLNQVSEFVKKGIYAGGGMAVEFGVIGCCDGIANGHEGMKYILPSREIICNSVEIMVQAHKLDGIVLLASCDKILPGMLMAAARLNIPAIVVNGGPMIGGVEFDGRRTDATSVDEAIGMLAAGKINEKTVLELENLACPSCGSCAFYGTANTMGCITEALGMSLTGSALIPATYADRLRVAYYSGKQICDLVEKNIKPRNIITEDAVRNGIKVTMATCGSTNAVLHLSAIAYEAGLKMNVIDEFEHWNKVTPQIAKVNPSSKWDMEDFYKAGGVPRVMKNLGELVHGSVMTVTGKTMSENLESYTFQYPENHELIKSILEPFSYTGGVAVLRGNLAPRTAITKPGAFDKSLHHFEGTAKVFDSEEEANDAILAGKVQPGDVVVIRYEGPKGGPGMREMYKALKYLYGMGLNKSTAVITDGRFSGTNNGCFVGHISPEAAEGGPLAIVENGDKIIIDVNKGILHVDISQEEVDRRLAAWKRPECEALNGYLNLYARVASSADLGAVIHR
jgi:dihydroxy-acid dehydratase